MFGERRRIAHHRHHLAIQTVITQGRPRERSKAQRTIPEDDPEESVAASGQNSETRDLQSRPQGSFWSLRLRILARKLESDPEGPLRPAPDCVGRALMHAIRV